MLVIYGFKAPTLELVLEKLNTYINRHSGEAQTIRIEAFHDGNYQFSKYMPTALEDLLKKLNTRGGKKLLTERGHFTIMFVSGAPTIQEYARTKVIWEDV